MYIAFESSARVEYTRYILRISTIRIDPPAYLGIIGARKVSARHFSRLPVARDFMNVPRRTYARRIFAIREPLMARLLPLLLSSFPSIRSSEY